MKYVFIDWKGKYLEIRGVYPHPSNSYDISCQQLTNLMDGKGLDGWVAHLREKNWWDSTL